MTTQHPRASILHAFADGKKIECRIYQGLTRLGTWREANLQDVCNDPGDMEYRIAPETINVNGVEVPKAICRTPYVPFVSICINDGHGNVDDGMHFCYVTEADARTVFDALCKPFKEGVCNSI